MTFQRRGLEISQLVSKPIIVKHGVSGLTRASVCCACLFAQLDVREARFFAGVCPRVSFVNDNLDAKRRDESLDLSVSYKAFC